MVNQEIGGSDHALLCLTLNLGSRVCVSSGELISMSAALGNSYHPHLLQKLHKSICHELVDLESMVNELNNLTPPEINEGDEVETTLAAGCNIVMDCAHRHTVRRHADCSHSWDQAQPRWQRLLSKNDCKTIWKTITWKGKVQEGEVEKPSENQFKEHWEQLLNVPNELDNSNDESFTSDIDNLPYIPVLDNPFSMTELDEAICLIKKKSYVGICLALLTIICTMETIPLDNL